MKNLRTYICLLLALVLCLSLAACSKEDKAFEEANALLEAGDYDGAIAAFSSIGRYQQITAKIEEAIRLWDEANAGFLVGTWRDLNQNCVITFQDGGTGTMEQTDSPLPITYSYTDGMVFIVADVEYVLDVQEVDGITHLTLGEGIDLVPEADYAAIGPEEVAITLDNWSEYFELREEKSVSLNSFGEVDYMDRGYGLFLKEEYYDRLSDYYEAVKVDAEITYDDACFKVVDYDKDTFQDRMIGSYELEPTKAPNWWPMETGHTTTASVYDRRHWEDGSEQDPYNLKVAAQFYVGGGFGEEGSTMYYFGASNVQISRIQGSLLLFP